MPRYSVTTAVEVDLTRDLTSLTVATLSGRTLLMLTPSPDAARYGPQHPSERTGPGGQTRTPRQAGLAATYVVTHTGCLRRSSKTVARTTCAADIAPARAAVPA